MENAKLAILYGRPRQRKRAHPSTLKKMEAGMDRTVETRPEMAEGDASDAALATEVSQPRAEGAGGGGVAAVKVRPLTNFRFAPRIQTYAVAVSGTS